MPTIYRPSEWRGKRQVYQSTDPNAPKLGNTNIALVIVAAAALIGLIAMLL